MGYSVLVAGWRVGVYREAGEAGGSFRGTGPRGGGGGGGWVCDPARSGEEAARRARAKVRRYCAANRLNRFGTLTYAGEGCHDPRVVRGDIGRFFRGVRRGLGGEPFPYLWVPELQKSGLGFRVHFAVGLYVHRGLIESAWGRGFVHIKLIGDLPVGSTSREEARVAARYLSKYLGKSFSGGGGLNRYGIAQGFQPKVEGVAGRTVGAVIGEASDRMGRPPEVVFRPDQQEGFAGPPSVWMSWR